MPIERLPFAQSIETRDGTLTTDAKTVNGYFETFKNKKSFVKRPGTATFSTLPNAQGQGMFYFNNQLYAVVNNILYLVNSDGTYTTIGTMTGSVATCYFNNTLPVPQASTNTATGNYVFSVAGSYTLTVPTGVYIMYGSVIGAGGGGGGGGYNCGDGGAGAGGGSGGYLLNQGFLVTPGQTINITVGAGGLHAYNNYTCAGVFCTTNSSGGSVGGTGGTSSIVIGGTTIMSATGGYGGNPTGGLGYGTSIGGAGGTPNGVAGSNNYTDPHNQAGSQPVPGGSNGTGYGTGGTSGTNNSVCALDGSAGAVKITF